MTVKQVETATVVGTITLTGNALVTVTAYGMTNSPKAFNVAVTNGDSAATVAGLIRTALAFDADVAALFIVSGSGADVVLTKHVAAANDNTLNIAVTNGSCTGLTPALTSANTTAGTGLTNGYCTVLELKNPDVLDIATTNTEHDTLIEATIEAVSRMIDNQCNRHFYQVTETRYFNTPFTDLVFVDDIAATSAVTIVTDPDGDGVYEDTWTATDYELQPYNNIAKGFPASMLGMTTFGNFRFPFTRQGIKVTATWGWAAIPAPINRACVLQAHRIMKRYITPVGQSAASSVGEIKLAIPALDPDVTMLLKPYMRLA